MKGYSVNLCTPLMQWRSQDLSEVGCPPQWRIYIVKFWTRAPPGGPNSFNFMQFLGKFGKIACSPSSGKSWIRHCTLRGGGAPTYDCAKCSPNCMKLIEFGPREGAPPLDPSMLYMYWNTGAHKNATPKGADPDFSVSKIWSQTLLVGPKDS